MCFFQIRQLDEAAARLVQGHPESADTIRSKQEEIHDEWTQLTAKANARKEKLLDSYDLQRFLSDYRDLSAWIQSMMGLVASDELASDVTGAEALLERHQVILKPVAQLVVDKYFITRIQISRPIGKGWFK